MFFVCILKSNKKIGIYFFKEMFNKNALDLLNEYGGDSSEDDVPGPRVSTKRSLKEDNEADHPKKRLQKLPVPQQFITLHKGDEHPEDVSLHEGRIRSFPHERGNWATFIYIPLEAKLGIAKLCACIEEIIPKHLDLKISEDFHLSLTKTVILKYHWIPSFVQTIKEKLGHFKKFFILFNTLKVYCNEERTRTFLGLQTRSGHDSLLSLVDILDRCLEEYELPAFYKDPSFHMSVAWCVGDVEKELQTYIPQLNQELENLMQIYEQNNWYIFVEYLMCKTGNKYFQFKLS